MGPFSQIKFKENVLLNWIVIVTHSRPETNHQCHSFMANCLTNTQKRSIHHLSPSLLCYWHEDKQLDWSSMKETHNKATDMISYGPFIWPALVLCKKSQQNFHKQKETNFIQMVCEMKQKLNLVVNFFTQLTVHGQYNRLAEQSMSSVITPLVSMQ